jgi:putative FmdB family regulatory protein
MLWMWVIHDKEVPNLPTYDYKCTRCNLNQEINHGWHNRPVILCNYCNEPMVKVIGAAATHFKGKGFYSTDK